MEIFDINHTLFTLWDYNVCLLELVGVVLGICSVWLATQGRAANFLVGIVSMSFLAMFFYQKGLYSSVILQGVLISFCAFGYYTWTKKPKAAAGGDVANAGSNATAADGSKEATAGGKKITLLTNQKRLLVAATILVFVGAWGSTMLFAKPDFLKAIFPENYDRYIFGYADAFVLIVAITGMYLRTQKKYESWFVFMSADITGLILYTAIGAYFVTVMCSIYLLLDFKGIYSWRKEMKNYGVKS
jgi:nicotinamide mononucleotide transporter